MYMKLFRHNQWGYLNVLPCGRTDGTLYSEWSAVAWEGCYTSRSFMQPRLGLFRCMRMLINKVWKQNLQTFGVSELFRRDVFHVMERIYITKKNWAENFSIISFCLMNLFGDFEIVFSYALQNTLAIVFKKYKRRHEEKKYLLINTLYFEYWIICCKSKLLVYATLLHTGTPTHWR